MPDNANRDILGFILTNTADPTEAANLADQLGQAALYLAPQVAFPPAWVLARQKSEVDFAAYAVRHCDDYETLTKIAASHLGRRSKVKGALRANKALTNPAYARGQSTPKKAGLPKLRTNRDKMLSILPDVTEAAHLHRLGFLNAAKNRTALANEAYSELESRDISITVSYVCSKLGITAGYYYCDFWKTGTLSVSDVLARLSSTERRQALILIYNLLTTTSYEQPNSANIDFDFIRVLMKAIYSGDRRICDSVDCVHANFTDDAIELLLRTPAWRFLLSYQTLNPTQIAKLITHTKPRDRIALFLPALHDPASTEVVLNSLPSKQCFDSDSLAASIMSTLGPGHPAALTLLDHIDATQALEFMTGEWYTNRYEQVLPTRSLLAPLLYKIRHENPEWVQKCIHNYVINLSSSTDLDYAKALVDQAPGGWRGGLTSIKELSAYIYGRLHATGAPNELIMDQLQAATAVSLDTLVAHLTALLRATSTPKG